MLFRGGTTRRAGVPDPAAGREPVRRTTVLSNRFFAPRAFSFAIDPSGFQGGAAAAHRSAVPAGALPAAAPRLGSTIKLPITSTSSLANRNVSTASVGVQT